MIVPALKVVDYERRYSKYSRNQVIEVLYHYLCEGKSHRWIDEFVLEQEGKQIKGYQAMAILHHLGVVKIHKGFFKGCTLEETVAVLRQQDDKSFINIISILEEKLGLIRKVEVVEEEVTQYTTKTLKAVKEQLEDGIKASLRLSKEQRGERLKKALRLPRLLTVTTTTYQRNADVVAEVLERANGVCERCGAAAPFIRVSDGTPYLEVHHKVRLADGGEDTVENAIAVCPNCHRELHFG